jgi:hypothetical protein
MEDSSWLANKICRYLRYSYPFLIGIIPIYVIEHVLIPIWKIIRDWKRDCSQYSRHSGNSYRVDEYKNGQILFQRKIPSIFSYSHYFVRFLRSRFIFTIGIPHQRYRAHLRLRSRASPRKQFLQNLTLQMFFQIFQSNSSVLALLHQNIFTECWIFSSN